MLLLLARKSVHSREVEHVVITDVLSSLFLSFVMRRVAPALVLLHIGSITSIVLCVMLLLLVRRCVVVAVAEEPDRVLEALAQALGVRVGGARGRREELLGRALAAAAQPLLLQRLVAPQVRLHERARLVLLVVVLLHVRTRAALGLFLQFAIQMQNRALFVWNFCIGQKTRHKNDQKVGE